MRSSSRTAPLTVVLCAVLCVPAARGAEKSGRPTEPLELTLGVRAGYDDNILQLSREEIDRLHEEPGTDRFRIESEDDLVGGFTAEIRWRVPHRGPRRTILRPRVDLHRYSRNGIKDYEAWGVRLSQEVNTSKRHRSWLGGEYRRIPSRYSREVTDDDRSAAAGTRIRDSLWYAEDRYGVSYRQRLKGRRLEASGRLQIRDRRYVDEFRERDGVRTEVSVALRGRPVKGSRLELEGKLSLEAYRADGDLGSTPIEDNDVSFRSSGAAVELEVPAGRRARLDLLMEAERRRYTTGQKADLSRFGREDLRWRFRLGYSRKLTRDLTLTGALQTRAVDASLPAGAGALDEETDYVESRLTLGLVWKLEL